MRSGTELLPAKRGLRLDRVVLLGRTFEEYRRYFLLKPQELIGKDVLDVAGRVSSFCAEANARGIRVTSFDPIYSLSAEEIAARSEPDLEAVYRAIGAVPTYRWGYAAGELPSLPFVDLTLVSYFLFACQDRLSYQFHHDSILEIMRVTRGEARIYPTVTFEGQPSEYTSMLRSDPALKRFRFTEAKTDFEFLVNSNSFLRVNHG
jgi:hypothetical protein